VPGTPMSTVPIQSVQAAAYTVPTDAPEADGTLGWDETTIVIARVRAGGREGIGYTYSHAATAELINSKLAAAIADLDAMAVPLAWQRMVEGTRNLGRPGITSTAIAAVDTALWDLKGKLLDVPLVQLLGMVHPQMPLYGSGGFTSYSHQQLIEQLGGWAAAGFRRVKMKVGTDPAADPERVRIARRAIGPEVELFVDANGAYDRKQALLLAERFAEYDVRWFEEPVGSDDLEGLRLLRNRMPPGMAVAAGEYGYRLSYFKRMLEAEAVDALQADATRCAGITEFMRVGALAQAWNVPFSAHTAPSLHLHACCALPDARHIEYFHDHVRIEHMFFDGAADADQGVLRPDLSRPGLGIELKEDVAERYRA
jgi:L-alanine-DL-glutamate epimerase-like enolase superfamily enzyme